MVKSLSHLDGSKNSKAVKFIISSKSLNYTFLSHPTWLMRLRENEQLPSLASVYTRLYWDFSNVLHNINTATQSMCFSFCGCILHSIESPGLILNEERCSRNLKLVGPWEAIFVSDSAAVNEPQFLRLPNLARWPIYAFLKLSQHWQHE